MIGAARFLGRGRGGEGAGACVRGLIRRRLLPDVCICCVSRNASVSVAWRELIVACRDMHINCFV